MDKQSTLGERINRYRTARGLSQLELSEQLDVSRQSISKWETDVAVPELSKIVRMTEIFEISLDELVLGKEPEREEEKAPPAVPAPAAEERLYRKIRNIMGFAFLAVGILFGAFCLFYGDSVTAIMMFIPCSISAVFCFKQFRLAALWCTETWFAFFAWGFYYGTGVSWNHIISPTVYAPKADRWMPFVAWTLFGLLAGLIALTVYSYRKHEFKLPKTAHYFLAAGALTALPLKKLANVLYHSFLLNIAANGDENYYRGMLRMSARGVTGTIEFGLDLAFIILFTACLVPTIYWVLRWFRRKTEINNDLSRK